MLQPRPSPRRGFTLIELLVVIAIIGVLVSLLLPAVQKIREAASRTTCVNNNKQIGLAIHNFHDAHMWIPPGGIDAVGFPKWNVPTGVTHSTLPFLLPYLEQDNLYRLYRWDRDWRAPENQPVVSTKIKLFICPSVPDSNRTSTGTFQGSTWRSEPSDYAPQSGIRPELALAGLVDLIEPNPTIPSNTIGSWGVWRNVFDTVTFPDKNNIVGTLTSVTDGLSNTVFFTEGAGRPVSYVRGPRVRPSSPTVGSAGWADRGLNYGIDGSSFDGEAGSGPCFMNCNNRDENFSFHPGGSIWLFGDGSVRFVREGLSTRVMGGATTSQGGEVLNFD